MRIPSAKFEADVLSHSAQRTRSGAPEIAVVIAAYNAEAFIQETLESVFAQTLAAVEIVVVNDGSTDRTADVLRRYSDGRLTVLHQRNSGVSAARNAGLAAVRAPYVFFLDADDLLAPDALARMTKTLDNNPDRVACFGHHIKIAESGSDLSTRSYIRWKLLPASNTLRHLIAKNFICGAICVRTDAARRVGGFDPSLDLGEDWEFWCRLAVLGDFAAMPDDIVLMYRQRFNSANYRLRESPLRPNYKALDVIYANPEIRRRFSFGELQRRRRLAEIDVFWVGARNEYVQGRMIGFLKYLAVGACWYPDSILRPRLVYLFVQGLRQPHDDGPREVRQRCLFLLTPSKEACAVENFVQKLVGALQSRYPDQGYEILPVSGRLRDLPFIFRNVAAADHVVFSLPLVAWKRMLLIPLVILLFASVIGTRVSVFMHEWKGLHWLRRIALAPVVLLSRAIVVVSPFISEQIAADWRLVGAGAKCRLVPHPPTVLRPPGRHVTERVKRVQEAAERADVVIGCFGSIYKGKAATALLDICRHLGDRGVRALIVFIGNFTKSLDHYEQEFWSKIKGLAIEDRVIVTGFIPSETELYTLFEEIGVFLFLFPEGLTARRSSVIACLQSDRPVLVPAPHSATEFDHHEGFSALIGGGIVPFIPAGADLQAIANQLLVVARQPSRTAPVIDAEAWWNAATAATRAALEDGKPEPVAAARLAPAE
jgi:glycosyltransferase involved in cell wall biosynthesis